MTEKRSSAADAVRAAVIRRPTGAAAAVRAASTFQGVEDPSVSVSSRGAVVDIGPTTRTTLHLPPALRIALKRSALDQGTTMGELIRKAVELGLRDPVRLSGLSLTYRRVGGGVRTTLDIPRPVHQTLKRLAVDQETTVQALVLAAIIAAHPESTWQ